MTRRAAGKHKSKHKPISLAKAPADGAKQERRSKKRACWRMRNVKRLVRAIFGVKDPVTVAANLLGKANDTTKAKILALLWEYLYGKPVQQIEANGPGGERGFFQFVTHAPRPQYPVGGNPQDDANKELCRKSLSGAVVAPKPRETDAADINEEDEND